MLTFGAHEEQHRTDDSRNRVKHHGRDDESRPWTSCGEKGRDIAIKEERSEVGGKKRKGEKEHEGNNMSPRQNEYTNIKEKVEQR